jgi:VIT1/CCC1 family predicted Fe2+/Mn2+ transporter
LAHLLQSIEYRSPDGPADRNDRNFAVTNRFASLQQTAASLAAALIFAAVFVGAAIPITPIV